MTSADWYLSEGIWLIGGGRLLVLALRLLCEGQLLLDVSHGAGSLLRTFGHFGFENHRWLPLRGSPEKFVFLSKHIRGGGGLNWNCSLGGGPP